MVSLIVLLLLLTGQCSSYKILAVMNCYHGHATSMIGVIKELESRGHEIRAHFTANCSHLMYPEFKGTLTYQGIERLDANFVLGNIFSGIFQLINLWQEEIERTYNQTEEIVSRESFDVVYCDYMLLGTNAVAEKRKIPLVVNAVSGYDFITRNMLHDDHYSLEPIFHGPEIALDAVVYTTAAIFHRFICASIRGLREKAELPDVEFSPNCFQGYQKRFPGIIVGSPPLHAPKQQGLDYRYTGYISQIQTVELSDHLKKWVEMSNDERNIVLISFGTVTSMDDEMCVNLLVDLLTRKTGYRYFWTFKYQEQVDRVSARVGEYDHGKVMLSPILDQSQWISMRRDRRILAFVTHCGLNSALETIDNLVPTVGIAGWADQNFIAHKFEELGLGVRLNVNEFTVNKFFDAIQQIQDNQDTYQQNLRKVKQSLRSYGGYPTGADVVERVAREKILSRENTVDIDTELSKRIRRNGKIVLCLGSVLVAVLSLAFMNCIRGCCKRKDSPSEKKLK